jgi:hypothetical protein
MELSSSSYVNVGEYGAETNHGNMPFIIKK